MINLKRITIAVISSLALGITAINTYAMPNYILNKSSITYKDKDKILIYNTHNNEEYIDSNVLKMGKDLAIKLEKKGYEVEVVNVDFERNDYNNAYYRSREYLKGLNLDEYVLIIDYHRDAIPHSNTANYKGSEVAKGMMVFSQSSAYFDDSVEVAGGITEYMDKFSAEIMRDEWVYESGILDFNSDLDDNMILFEAGNNSNKELEVKRLNTYFASAIDSYLKNKIN